MGPGVVDLPLIEGGGPLLPEHGERAAHGAVVAARLRIHEARLHHVHRGRHHRGAEACREGCREVARKVVCRGGGNVQTLEVRGKEKEKEEVRLL